MSAKIPAKYKMPVFAFVMSFCTGLIVSGVMCGIRYTGNGSFFSIWLNAFLAAWPVVFVCIIILAPLVTRLVDKLVENDASKTT